MEVTQCKTRLACATSSTACLPLITQSSRAIDIDKNLLLVEWVRDWNHIVVAGGHVLNAVIGDKEASDAGDIDIFLIEERGVSPSPEDVRAIATNIHEWLVDHFACKVMACYSRMGITFLISLPKRRPVDSKRKKKVTLVCARVFGGVFDLLQSFDLANCEFAYRMGQVYATGDALQYLNDFTIRVYSETEKLWTAEAASIRERRIKKYKGRKYNTVIYLLGYRPGRATTVDPMYIQYQIENADCDRKKYPFGLFVSFSEALELYTKNVGGALKEANTKSD
jgi:hypothetical protein